MMITFIALSLLGSLSSAKAQTVTYNSSPNLAIPGAGQDRGRVSDSIFVDASFEICDVDISVDITHTWTADLELDLTMDGPDPTTDPVDVIRLQYDDCGSSDDLVVTFDDSATESLNGASSTNNLCNQDGLEVQPEEALSTFNGHQSIGYWTLDINDDAVGDTGTLNSWSITLTACETITDGAGTGDPHFKSWAGKWFDFHGECDLVFVDSPKFGHGTGLAIHIRTKARYQYSYIESAAVQIGDSVLEVGEYGSYMLDGISNADLDSEKLDSYTVTHKKINSKQDVFTIELGEGKQIVIQSFKDLVSVKTVGASFEEYRGSQGLLGEFGTGKLLSRNGTIMTDPDAFGNEWQVLETEPKLFQTARFPQHPVQCSMPGPERDGRRRLGESTISMEAAEEACEHWGDLKDQCVYDVMAAEDLELAEAGAF
ncbi:expressed unknown protein [Seminavis robusta]|uniref:P/Homo B domain-containing protein n=1 Tax=Seminavis robusta TaxID=568900 RepID=A0A9N8H4P8_9STRA|nr:expressed unknown protein [Seminavis robusta]|eukprot:Sro55_g032371.1  (428) ;mRNA; f:92018-93301